MKQLLLLPVFVFMFVNAYSQTFYFPSTASLVSSSTSACEEIDIQITGNFSDGCGYFPSTQTTLVSGSSIYCYLPARNLGCDSGYLCTMALVPVNQTISFPAVAAPNGSYSLFVIYDNVCMGVSSATDTVNLGILSVTSLSASTVLTSNAPPSPLIGSSVVYSITTNVPAIFTSNWYRNNVLSYTGVNATSWPTTILSASDTIKVMIAADTSCVDPETVWSNELIIQATPSSIPVIVSEQAHISYNANSKQLVVHNAAKITSVRLYSMTGEAVKQVSSEGRKTIMMDLKSLSSGVYVVECIGSNKRFIEKIQW